MRRHDRPFSNDVDDDHDITQQFWGTSRGWTDQPDRPRPTTRPRAPRRDDTTGAIRAIRDGFAAFRPRTSHDASGPIDRTRSHGIIRPHLDDVAAVDDADSADPAGHQPGADPAWTDEDEFWHDADTARLPAIRRSEPRHRPASALVRPEPVGERLAAVDPLLLRVGVFIAALVVLFPVAWAMRSDGAGTVTTGTAAETSTALTPTTQVADLPQPSSAAAPAPAPAGGDAPIGAAPAPEPEPTESQTPTAPPEARETSTPAAASAAPEQRSTTTPDESQAAAEDPPPGTSEIETQSAGIEDEPATVGALADRVEPDCSLSYIAQPGDSWYSVAEAAGITPTELISSNQATLETIILPGDEICLPSGATVPPQTTTTTSTTTTTVPDSTPPTTDAPVTSAAEVQQLIRDIWPDELEEKALEVAFRESRYQHDAYNGWCCYGVFQIYWSVHQSWLDDYGIYRAEDLFDARKNIEAAYALYRAAGGWSPWSQTAY